MKLTAIGRDAAVNNWRHCTNWRTLADCEHIWSIDKVWADVPRCYRVWFATDIFVLVNHFVWKIFEPESDDDAVNSRDSLCVIAPLKRAMREMNLNALRKDVSPKHTDLLPLRN